MHEGHRQRIDKKAELFGFEGLSEHEQLEQLLYAVIPRKNTNFLAHDLIARFGTLHGVLTAIIKDLEAMVGVGHRTAVFLTSLPDLLGAIYRSAFKEKRLSTTKEIYEYVETFFFGKLVEAAYLILLNPADSVISFERLSEGVASETYIYPAKVAKAAVVANASKVIIAHNHPGGISKPSNQDILLTRKLLTALNAVDIEFKDSIIVARGECFSMREHGYLSIANNRY